MSLGFNIFSQPIETIDFNKIKIINTINPHSYCISKKDKLFEKALKSSDILLPDGIGVVLAEKIFNNKSCVKISGYDLFVFMMKKLNDENGSVFFLGSSEKTLREIENKIFIEFPNVKCESYSPPFKKTFSDEDSKLMCEKVNDFKPCILFVGMTAPKQEKWVYNFKDSLQAKNICSVGAVFDFYSGKIKRSSKFWISIGMEWFPRFLAEPRRLFKRNFISSPKFMLEIILLKFFGKGFL